MTTQVSELANILIAGILLGANVWFFFVQSPVLVKSMGRDRFVPIQMRLTKILFRFQAILAVLLVSAAILADAPAPATIGAVVAATTALAAHFFVVPNALRAGGKGRVETAKAGGDTSVGKFISDGSGPSASFWHRMVVFCVVLILAGVVVDLAYLA